MQWWGNCGPPGGAEAQQASCSEAPALCSQSVLTPGPEDPACLGAGLQHENSPGATATWGTPGAWEPSWEKLHSQMVPWGCLGEVDAPKELGEGW